MSRITYKDAGVDLETYRESMGRLPKLMQRTHTPRVMSQINGFAGLFRLDLAKSLFSHNYQDPVLVACTDGVGTKLKLAQMVGRHDTVGIDLVAMCVNDAICSGAQPLFFLDYVAMSSDDPDLLEKIVQGISSACVECDAALLGGETAIMPDLYRPGDYDLAGFCVGVVDRARLIDGKSIRPNDVVLGVASSGVHSNGFSLVRKIVFDHAGLSPSHFIEEAGQSVADCLMEPTTLYVRPVQQILRSESVDQPSAIHGIAHITGGGLHENLQRILPATVDAKIVRDSWPQPSVFGWLQKLGNVADDEMCEVFNMGVGLALVVARESAEAIQEQLRVESLESWVIGEIVPGQGSVAWK